MKKKWLKTGVVVSLLLGILSLAFSAAAEENGYWTMKTDESGNPVMIYTYTKPVDWVITEDADSGQCDEQPTQPISAVEKADAHMAANSPAAAQTVNTSKTKTNPASHPLLFTTAGIFACMMTALILIKYKKHKFSQKVCISDHPYRK